MASFLFAYFYEYTQNKSLEAQSKQTLDVGFVSNHTYLLANYHQISSAFEQTVIIWMLSRKALSLMANPEPALAVQTFMFFPLVTIRYLVHRKFISTLTQSTKLPGVLVLVSDRKLPESRKRT
jgi:hypothetical protein